MMVILTAECTYGEDEVIRHIVLDVPKNAPKRTINKYLGTFWDKTRREDDHYVRGDGCAAISLLNWSRVRAVDEAVIRRYFNVG